MLGTVCISSYIYYYYTFETNQTSLMAVLMEIIIKPDIGSTKLDHLLFSRVNNLLRIMSHKPHRVAIEN